MNRVTLECGAIQSRTEFHESLAREMNFPDWYGGNLDALHDLLTAIGTDTVLQLHDWPAAEAALGLYGSRVEKVLALTALKNPHLTVEFC